MIFEELLFIILDINYFCLRLFNFVFRNYYNVFCDSDVIVGSFAIVFGTLYIVFVGHRHYFQ